MKSNLSKYEIYNGGNTKKQKKLKNQFEAIIANRLPESFGYETKSFDYILHKKYWPDFVDEENKIIIEAKQQFFNGMDRRKMRTVAEAHPNWRIIMIFGTPNATINPNSKTTYKMWAEKQGFEVYSLDTIEAIDAFITKFGGNDE